MKIQKQITLIYLLLLSLHIQNVYSQNTRVNNNITFLSQKISRQLQAAEVDEIRLIVIEYLDQLSMLCEDIDNITEYVGIDVSQYTSKAIKIISTISSIISYQGVAGFFANCIVLAFQQISQYDAQTAQALYNLRSQVYQLSSQIQNLKVEVISSLNAFDENLSFRSIDQDIYILQSFLLQYQEFADISDSDLILYKQLCGNKMYRCNESFLSVASGLKDFFRTIRNSSNWSRATVSSQYIVYSSFLLNAMNALADINLRFVLKELDIEVSQLTADQVSRYSQIYLLQQSLLSLSKDFDDLFASTYETTYQNISIGTNKYNDLSILSSGLLLGIFRGQSGDGVNSITQTKVANRYDDIRNIVEINVTYLLDDNNVWMNCPKHTFLKGITLSGSTSIHYIENITCVSFERFFADTCQQVDVSLTSNNSWATCPDGTFIAGIFKGNGDKVPNFTRLNCCSLTNIKSSEVEDAYNRTAFNTQWKPNGGDVYFTYLNNKAPLASIKVYYKYLSGNLQTSYKKNFSSVVETKTQDTLLTFDQPNLTGRCPQDFFLTGINQNTSQNFSHIEKLYCTKYANTYWNQCFEQQVKQYNQLQQCGATNSCAPSILECEVGSYFVGFKRGSPDNWYGINRVVCCTMTSTSGQFKE